MSKSDTTGLRVLVCGGRQYGDEKALRSTLEIIHAERTIASLIQGGARGADTLALSWARDMGIPCQTYQADWEAHGRAAGPIRNARMLAEGKPDLVVVAPGNAGTDDMVRKARAAGVEIHHV